jgi:DNA-binding CsgD family transcriptional regulator
MLESTTLIELNDVCSCFYDAALGNVSWDEPLRQAAIVMKTGNAVFSVRDPVTRRANFSFGSVGFDQKYKQIFAETYATLSPFVVATAISPEGTVVNPINLIGRDEYEQGRFYKEWSEPQGYHDYIGSVLLRQPNAIYTLAFGRLRHLPLFDEVDHAKLEFLIPHVTRALQISERLNTFERERAELLTTIDSLAAPIFLIDRDRKISQVNSAGVTLMEARQGVLNLSGSLSFTDRNIEQEFRTVHAAKSGHAILLNTKLSNGMHIHMLTRKLESGGRYQSANDDRTLVIIDRPRARTNPIGEDVIKRFGFTVAELRVLLLLIDGRTINDAAVDLGISKDTVKSHTAHMFQKTGTHRQQDLIRVVLEKVPASPFEPTPPSLMLE